jgi:hypothetical protein
MARISTYPIDTDLVGADKWIGTDATNKNATKNFTLSAVADWINTTASVDSQTLRYEFQAVSRNRGGQARKPGTISFDPNLTETVPFDSIGGFVISSYSLKYASQAPPTDISEFYTKVLIGSYIFLTNSNDVSKYAIYIWDSAVARKNNPGFWDIGLTLVTSNGSFENNKDYFISLLTYNPNGGGGDKNFVFKQGVPAKTWTITHDLDKFPSVSIVDSAGQEVICTVDYIDIKTIRVTFNVAFSGEAYLN